MNMTENQDNGNNDECYAKGASRMGPNRYACTVLEEVPQ